MSQGHKFIRNDENSMVCDYCELCPPQEFVPTDETYGYRWVSCCKEIYIVKMKIIGNYKYDTYTMNTIDYIADDFLITEIIHKRTGDRVDELLGRVLSYHTARYPVKVGYHVQGIWTCFCLSIEDLYRSQGKLLNWA